ncbi:MAG: SRPBCC family protein [Burkholderiales bacterium]
MLKKILLGVAGLLVALVLISFILPADYRVERSLEIAAPPEKIYPLIADPREWKNWGVWNQRDPNMKMEYSGAPSGAGAKWTWESKSEGSGSMEFTRAEAPAMVEYTLYFPEFGSRSGGKLTLTPSGNATRVSWTNEGNLGSNPLNRYFGLLMDKMLGDDFIAGLKNLKALAEKNQGSRKS